MEEAEGAAAMVSMESGCPPNTATVRACAAPAVVTSHRRAVQSLEAVSTIRCLLVRSGTTATAVTESVCPLSSALHFPSAVHTRASPSYDPDTMYCKGMGVVGTA
jgi:hypothetical protein